MDLEIVGKQMLETLAVQGQVAGLVTKLEGLRGEITGAEVDIQKAESAKASSLVARKQAEEKLDKAISEAESVEQLVVQAKAKLKSAEMSIVKAEEESTKYSDEVLDQLDDAIGQCKEVKTAIEAKRDEGVKELELARKDLESRQAELKAQGIELNIGSARQPITTVL